MVRLLDVPGSAPKRVTVIEQNGVYDLTDIADLNGIAVILPPGPTYYPNVLLTPETAAFAVPVGTDQYDTLRAQYLSQRFVLELPDGDKMYSLTVSLSGRHAIRVYVGSVLAGQTGRPGTAKADTEIWENNMTCYAFSKNNKAEIIVQTAQFYHFRSGARLATLTLENASDTVPLRLSEPTIGFIAMGALLCSAVLLLGAFLLLSHTRTTLFFALACLAMALRECIQSQAWTYFPVSGNLVFMLEYMSLVLLTVFLCLYLTPYAVNTFLKAELFTALIGSFAYGLLLLTVDSVLYTRLLVFYQILLILSIIPGIGGLFWTIRRPNREQTAALYGLAVFYLAAVTDILMSGHLFGNGRYTTISEAAMLVFVLAQTVSLFQMNNRLLTQAKEAEQQLEAEKTALESLNRLKTEFLGNVSHELKTPLTVMSGYAQTTRQLAQQPDTLDGGEVSRRMTLISSEAERLSLMVGQVLDVTRMEEGRMVMEPIRCYVDEIIHAAVETHYPILNKNHNRLDIRIESGLPAIHADPARISQVIVNLVSNAVRFTADGVITISAKKEHDKILVCVSDTGVGITAERLPHVFERYSKKQKSGRGQDNGTGLGLYICKHIVEQHGGEIRIESKDGSGTDLFFTLPVLEG